MTLLGPITRNSPHPPPQRPTGTRKVSGPSHTITNSNPAAANAVVSLAGPVTLRCLDAGPGGEQPGLAGHLSPGPGMPVHNTWETFKIILSCGGRFF